MKVYVDGIAVGDSEQGSTIIIVFKDDKQRLSTANTLMSGFEPKKGPRLYGVFPDTATLELMESQLDTVYAKEGGADE